MFEEREWGLQEGGLVLENNQRAWREGEGCLKSARIAKGLGERERGV